MQGPGNPGTMVVDTLLVVEVTIHYNQLDQGGAGGGGAGSKGT